MRGTTSFLVERSRGILWEHLPEDVIEVACQCVLDWLGGAISGGVEPLVQLLVEEAKEQGAHPRATVVLHGLRTSPMLAAMINGSAADALDYSDANRAMRGHTTPAIVAAALAVSEARGTLGKQFLAALVAGVELACRLGLGLQPPKLRAGFHPTGNLVPFGATAAVAHLLGLSEQQWAHALGVAATQAAGLLASGGTMSKPFHSGKAAMHGVLSADLASRGFVARPDAIEASEGFLYTHGNEPDEAAMRESPDRCLILDTIFKRHAACMLTHSSLDNMLTLRSQHRVSPERVHRIELHVQPNTLHVCNLQEPKTGLEAKFSFRAACAMALLGDDTADIGAYTAERATSAEVVSLRDRISVTAREDLPGGTQRAIVELVDGQEIDIASDAYRPLGDFPVSARSCPGSSTRWWGRCSAPRRLRGWSGWCSSSRKRRACPRWSRRALRSAGDRTPASLSLEPDEASWFCAAQPLSAFACSSSRAGTASGGRRPHPHSVAMPKRFTRSEASAMRRRAPARPSEK